MIPKVDTFAQDIAEEIKSKDASVTEISSASNDVKNEVAPPKKSPVFLIVLSVLSVFAVIGLGALAYYYFTDPLLTPPSQGLPVSASDVPATGIDLQKITPTLSSGIGHSILNTSKQQAGYIITINEYSPVFAYMTRNESAYIGELIALFPIHKPVVATTTPVIATTTPIVASTTIATTTTSTSTKKIVKKVAAKTVATSTLPLATTTPPIVIPVIDTTPSLDVTVSGQTLHVLISDVTISNQNMRVYKYGEDTLVTAFIGDKAVAISDSTDGILALRSAILH